MRPEIVILEAAEQDLRELRSYIVNNFSSKIWQATYSEIKPAIRNLQDFPFAGISPPELEKLDQVQYRQVISGMNRIIYEVRRDAVYIHVIADARRNMSALLMRRLLRTSWRER